MELDAGGGNTLELLPEGNLEGRRIDRKQTIFADPATLDLYAKGENDGIEDELFVNTDQWLSKI